MKRKNAVVIVMSFVLIGAVLAGCGKSRQSGQDIPMSIPQEGRQESTQENEKASAAEKSEPETMVESEPETAEKSELETVENFEPDTVETTGQESERYEDNFAVDSEAAKEFAGKIKDAAAQKDLEALAELTAFPVYVGLPDVNVVETKEDFLKLGAETVFTDELLKSVEAADIDNFQPSMAGFSISGGGTANINFGVVDGVLAITGINY